MRLRNLTDTNQHERHVPLLRVSLSVGWTITILFYFSPFNVSRSRLLTSNVSWIDTQISVVAAVRLVTWKWAFLSRNKHVLISSVDMQTTTGPSIVVLTSRAGMTCYARREYLVQNCNICSVLNTLKYNPGKINNEFITSQ